MIVKITMSSNISRNAKITKRVGDVYFSEVIRGFPPIPQIYERFIPEDYKELITEEERTERYISIGSPYKRGEREDSTKSRLISLFLVNVGKEFNRKDLEKALNVNNVYSSLRSVEFDFNYSSKFFRLSKNGKPFKYSLTEISPDQKDLERINELDIELGIAQDIEIGRQSSLNSARL